MPAISRPTIYLIIGAVIVGAIFMNDNSSKASATSKSKTEKKATAKKEDAYDALDRAAKFPRLEVGAKNVFVPIVATATKGKLSMLRFPNAIPPEYANGDPNWIYTGTAVIDGSPTALIENASTQEGAFLKHGDKWKSSTISTITTNSVVLLGPGGRIKTLELMADAPDLPGSPMSSMAGVRPMAVPPSLTGAIGGPGGASFAPSGATGLSPTADPTGGGNGGGRRRGNRGRGNDTGGALPGGISGGTSAMPPGMSEGGPAGFPKQPETSFQTTGDLR